MSDRAPRTVGVYASVPVTRHADGSDAHTCPLCGQHGLIRIRRRFIDRILSLFVRQRRFRCTQPGCQWRGNLREKTARRPSGGKEEKLLS